MSRLNRRVDPQTVEALERIDLNLVPVYREWRGHFAGECTGPQLLKHLQDRYPAAAWLPSLRTLYRQLRVFILPTETKILAETRR